MAMTIMNNSSTMMTLGELNKNTNNQSKGMKKLASGLKIASAQDDASGYSISERMRARIRGLGQDIKNVQTGSKLLAVAEGGMREILENLRSMKEMAINAANDHNTDLDRETLQKEFSQRLSEINDIATSTTYNGKLLLMGDYHEPTFHLEHVDETYTKTTTITQPSGSEYGYIGADGVTYVVQKNVVSGMVDNFSAMPFTKYSGVTSSSPRTGRLYPCDNYTYSSAVPAGLTEEELIRYKKRQGIKMDFTGMQFNDTSLDSLDFSSGIDNGFGKICNNINELLDEQGFIIMCAGCDQFINIRFDNDSDIADSQYNDHLTGLNVSGNSGSQNREYVVGIRDVNITDTSELAAIVFEGVANSAGKPTVSNRQYRPISTDTNGIVHYSGSGESITEKDDENNLVLDPYHSVMLRKNEKGEYYISKDYSPNIYLYDKGFNVVVEDGIENAGTTTSLTTDDAAVTKTITESVRVVYDKLVADPYQPLVIHDGTKANERINVFINDMRTSAMQLDGVTVTTGDNARGAIIMIDDAIEYTLNECTTMGAYSMRLEKSEANLVTSNENTQASESTIRDADMAKEMVNYTKANVLSQSAQSMLAQANQNASSVLSLLQ